MMGKSNFLSFMPDIVHEKLPFDRFGVQLEYMENEGSLDNSLTGACP
jgi:hypothetical protein